MKTSEMPEPTDSALTKAVDWAMIRRRAGAYPHVVITERLADEILFEWGDDVKRLAASDQELAAEREAREKAERERDLAREHVIVLEHSRNEARAARDAAVAENARLVADHARDLLAVREVYKAENVRLRTVAQALVDFDNGPYEAKRPDVFRILMARLTAALIPDTST